MSDKESIVKDKQLMTMKDRINEVAVLLDYIVSNIENTNMPKDRVDKIVYFLDNKFNLFKNRAEVFCEHAVPSEFDFNIKIPKIIKDTHAKPRPPFNQGVRLIGSAQVSSESLKNLKRVKAPDGVYAEMPKDDDDIVLLDE